MRKTTSNSAPKVAAGMVPCGDYVLVDLVKQGEQRTEAGLFVPTTGDNAIRRGVVQAVSPHVTKSKFGIKPGDAVLISKFARTEEVSMGRVLVHAEAIMAATSAGPRS